MARKIQFEIAQDSEKETDAAQAFSADPTSKAPSLSAMAKSLHAAAAASIREIDPRLIEESQFQDRIPDDDLEVADLAASIHAQGQLIPILVSPIAGGRFRIIYGRRRLAALRTLNLPAKALVRDLDEDQAIIAQGQENTFRKDLSWIEKAMFARQLVEAGKPDELICDTLNIDQKARREGEKLTGLSRMKQVMSKLDHALVEAVGPAPKVGRDRWYGLAQLIDKKGFPPGNQSHLLADVEKARDEGMSSDERFDRLEQVVKDHSKTQVKSTKPIMASANASMVGTVRANARSATITVTSAAARQLHLWIATNPDEALRALVEAQQKFEQQQ
ncbi:plasmid partitioning protein RepB [Paracoccus litorisediminis]|uniref:plasmid partitioning protein RepB n=1 Tax=Paracoccus litorisediminis TaxID=2006130 RepID=UPI0037331FD8